MNQLDKHLEELTPILRDVVVVYILNEDGTKVILGERKKLDKPGLGKRVGIGGGVEKGETELETTLREVIEEIGTDDDGNVVFQLKSAEPIGTVYFLFPHLKDEPGYNQRCYVFVSREFEGTPVETKPIKPEWYPIDELPEKFMWPDNLLWVPQVLRGEKINGIFLYDENNKVIDYRLEP